MYMQRNLPRFFFYCITGILLTINVSAQNMVRKWVAQRPIVNESDMILTTATVQDVLQTSEYVDGFGRPTQSVAKKTSPLQKDALSMHVYDAMGREVKMYMPFISNVAVAGDIVDDGNFKTNAAQQQTAFNQGLYTGETTFYSEISLENSPLNRVMRSYAPGSSWGQSWGKSIASLLNTDIDNVRIWNILDAQGSLPTTPGAYTTGQLYKSRASDENGLQTIEFKDKDGHIILKKVQLSATGDAGTGNGHTGWLCTYYVYDDYGNMRFIITPRVVELIEGGWAITQAMADELCYRNEYDDFGRAIIAKSPGAEEQWSVYDKLGRLVMSQDANMRQASQKQWKYYQYENSLDRLKATGLLTDPTNYNNRVFHQSAASAATQIATSLSAYPALGSYTIEQLTQTYYDEYASWVTGTGLIATADLSKVTNTSFFYAASNVTFPYPQVVTTQSAMTRGMVTGSKTEVLKSSGPNYLYTVSYYDDKGRIIQTQGTNISGAGVVDKATTQYSWNGTPLRILEEHAKTGTNPQTHTVLTKMNYDFAGRLQNTTKTITSFFTNTATTISNPEKTIATYMYDEMSRVKTKTLGTKPNTNNLTGPALETLNYDYNVRGWLTGINKAYTQYASTANYFGMELGYDKAVPSNTTTSFTPVFNGNISGMIWKSKSDGVPRKYDYTYDNVNQLTQANFLQSSGGSTWDKTSVDYSVNSIQYDLNGNIKKLNQNGFVLGGASNIDDLTYNYGTAANASSNKLMNVLDAAPNNAQSKLGDYHYTGTKTSTTIDYGYDPNGNLISDVNKGITSITYNMLNLPWIINTTIGTITYTYDAAGNKLKKVTQENGVNYIYSGNTYLTNIITTTTYIGGFVYQDKLYTNTGLMALLNTAPFSTTEALQYLAHEEGRTRIVTPQYGTINFAFDYFIRDHLGNVRLTLTDEPQIDYYPVATLEALGNAVPSEQRFYNITPANIVSTGDLGMSWYSTALNNNYQNNNGLGDPPDKLTINRTNTSTKLYKLPANGGAMGTDHTGLGITLKVTTGDVINIYGKSVWHNSVAVTNTNYLNTALLAFLNAFTGTGAVIDGSKGIANGTVLNGNTATTGPLNTWLGTGVTPPLNTPKAGFNWILFDEQFKPVFIGNSSGYIPVKSAPNDVQTFSFGNAAGGDITIPKSGYLYVYCSNESNQDVYFDNLQVVQTRSQLIEEKHFYPGGLAMQGISGRSYGKLANAFGYQGKEMQAGENYDGTGLEEYDFEARYYDPQLMRWHNVDPIPNSASPYSAMANNPVSITDPDGKCPACIAIAIGAAIGAASSAAIYSVSVGSSWNWGDFGKAFAFGAVGGALSGGLGSAGVGASLGTFGQSLAYNVLSSTVSSVGTNVAFGNTITLGTLAGSAIGGLIAGSYGNFTGVSGGAIKNTFAEIGFNTAKGAVSGAFGGAIGASIDGQNIGVGFLNGAKYGAIGAGISSGLMIASFGAAMIPNMTIRDKISEINDNFGISSKYAPVFRRGGLYGLINPRGVTWGRSLILPEGSSDQDYIHEYFHFVEQVGSSFGTQAGHGIYEQIRYTLSGQTWNPYQIPGTYEYSAQKWAEAILPMNQ